MKYAIIMSGYLRSGINNYNYFNDKIFKNIDYDLFIYLFIYGILMKKVINIMIKMF